MANTARRIVDGDGHIFEDAAGIRSFLPPEWEKASISKMFGFWPQFGSHLFFGLNEVPPGSFVDPGVEGWREFLDAQGFDATVLYPSAFLHFGRIPDLDLALGVAKAYNNWLHRDYLTQDDRFKGMAMIPLQDPQAAALELRRAVKELGMCGAMLTGVGHKGELGTKEFWPIYEEADSLGCALALHAGSHAGLGLDHMNIVAGSNALGHPLAVAIGFVSMMLNGVFDRFPNVRYGFLEAGVGWFLMAVERCTRSFAMLPPLDPNKQYLRLPPGEDITSYLRRLMKEGRVVVGVEGGEPNLADAVRQMGNEGFMYSSDFPHEATKETIGEEIGELLANEALTEDDRDAILYRNAVRFYSFQLATAAK
ncbi:MAG: 2,3-dihydroxybenzoate decarboxylase [Chloroflexi bacterium]|jgi:hypothetical protein|nr:MAG: 2,3-dihydroxybenzoate decarboxylase [Chloroflexota bacterium]